MVFKQPDGSYASNGFWVRKGAAWTTTELLLLGATLKDWWVTGDGTQKPYNFVNANYELAEVNVRDYTTASSAAVSYNTGLPVVGNSGSTTPLPMGMSFALTLRTGLAGRSYRGRTYLLGLDVTDLTSELLNSVSSSAAADFVLAYNAMITAISGSDPTQALVVCSRHWNGGVAKAPMISRAAGIMTPVIGFGFSKLTLDFQRSRAPNH
jgi:hypothetical protein